MLAVWLVTASQSSTEVDMWLRVSSATFLLLLAVLHRTGGHVSLSYPPARQPSLDFLDNLRTAKEDCGVSKKDGGVVTVLEVGAELNITWSMTFVHRGGYRVELVVKGKHHPLVPQTPTLEWQTGDPTAQFHQNLRVPDVADCTDNCYLKLLRQASEFGPNFHLRSCADIKIVPAAEVKNERPATVGAAANGTSTVGEVEEPLFNDIFSTDKCNGRGFLTAEGECECDGLYTGEGCLYTTQCKLDSDCNAEAGGGECVELDNTVFSDRRCFCSLGWFGSNCKQRSYYSSPNFFRYEYIKTNLGNLVQRDGPTLYWRVRGGELEMIVEAATTSWVGIGWRPADTTQSCQSFPSEEDQPEPRGQYDFHHMDCTDMVIGMARGDKGYIGDYYSRDRSTPQRDEFWGGTDDLSDGMVFERKGVTIMKFKKPLKGGAGDQNFGQRMHVIWAYGQDSGFYKEDQLKYHGSCTNCQGQATLYFRT